MHSSMEVPFRNLLKNEIISPFVLLSHGKFRYSPYSHTQQGNRIVRPAWEEHGMIEYLLFFRKVQVSLDRREFLVPAGTSGNR